jgi:copper transport protein
VGARRAGTVAGALVTLALLVSTAAPAHAHAVLLRSEPSAQATLTQGPAGVRLHFSEPVESALGALRVFDTTGRQVSTGTPTRADGGRQLDVGLANVKDGTYVVDWRVISSDGHPAFGSFTFYVGTPSATSALASGRPTAAPAAATWGFGVLRFVWFSAFMLLVGAVAVRRWVWTPAVRATDALDTPAHARFVRRFDVLAPAAVGILVVAGLLQLPAEATTVSGVSIGKSLTPHVLGQVVGTGFGRLWLATVVLSVAMAVPVLALTRRPRLAGLGPATAIAAFSALAVGMALASAANGHARTERLPAVAVPMVAVHLLAVAVWAGGLCAFLLLGVPAWGALPDTRKGMERKPVLLGALVKRFSTLALVAVALVAITGTIGALGELGPFTNLWHVTYGRLLLAKIVLLALALVLAARHFLVTPRRLAGPGVQSQREVGAFERTSASEAAVLTTAVIVAAALVAVAPGRTVTFGSSGPLVKAQHAGPYQVELAIEPLTVGPNQLHVTFLDSSGVASSDVDSAAVSIVPPKGPVQPIDLQAFSGGHWTALVTLPLAGPYRLTVSGRGAQTVRTTFHFRLAGGVP